MPDQLTKFADDLFSAVHGYIKRSLEPLRSRVETLEKMAPAKDGRDASPEAIAEAVELAVGRLPPAKDGASGVDGKSVDMDEIERMVHRAVAQLPKPMDGKDGIDGAPGQRGLDGRDGKDGEPGRDALATDILPSIDVTRSYPRGTFASHAGALIRSTRTTDPITGGVEVAGWQVIFDPVVKNAMVQSADDPRSFESKSFTALGKETSEGFYIPTLIDRGVFSYDKAYTEGDVVTWAGSMWIAQKPSQKIAPGGSEGVWRLAVKHGRDGKDGVLLQKPATVKLS